MKKKLLLGIALALMILTLFTLCVNAQTPVEEWDISATSSDSVVAYLYEIRDAQGTLDGYDLRIEGTGNMADLSTAESQPWRAQAERIKSIVIGEGVTGIGDRSFQSFDYVISAQLPSTLEYIGASAFDNCKAMTEINLPQGLTYIKSNAFVSCRSLTTLVIPSSVTTIDNYAFNACGGLSMVYIPSSVVSVGSHAFANVREETVVYAEVSKKPSGWNEKWNKDTFGTTKVVWGHTHTYDFNTDLCVCGVKDTSYVEKWDISASENDSVFAYLYEDLQNAGYYTLVIKGSGNMVDFNSRNLPPWRDSYRSVITELTIEEGVTSIGANSFSGFQCITEIYIPNSVTTISGNAFTNCANLITAYIGNGLTSFDMMVNALFTRCSSLEHVIVSEDNPYLKSVDGVVFSKDETYLYFYPYGKTAETYIVPDSVKTIAGFAFGQAILKNIVIPNGVLAIGNSAFIGSYNLEKLVLPNTVGAVGSSAFSGCTSLKTVFVPLSVEYMESSIFKGCTSATIYCEATSVPEWWFSGWNPSNCPVVWGHSHTYENGVCECGKAYTYTEKWDISATANDSVFAYLYEDLENAGYYTLVIKGNGKMLDWTSYEYYPWYDYKDSILTVTVENGITNIGNSACHMLTNLSSVSIPSSVTSIGDYSFAFTASLTNVTIPTTVTSLGNAAFTASGLVNVLVPNSVVTMGEGVFGDCRQLVSVTLPNGLTSIPNSTFYYCQSLEGVTIPSGVTSIGAYAFYGCEGMDTIYISKTVDTVGYQAFYVCYGLTIYCEASSRPANWSDRWVDSNATVVWGHTHSYENNVCVCGKQYIEKWDISASPNDSVYAYLYEDLENADYYTLVIKGNGNMKNWSSYSGSPWYSSYRNKIKSITIEAGVTTIGEKAFWGCDSLTSIAIPDGVTSIGACAFYVCYSLTSVELPDTVTSIGKAVFTYCTSLTSVNIPDNVTSIGDDVFYECNSLTSIVIPDGITSIGACAFYNCYSLTNVVIGEGVTSIGNLAFRSCYSLTSIKLPNGVISIGESAFNGCKGLTSIVIPDSLTSIGGFAFSNCDSLTTIKIPNNVTSIDKYAFNSCDSLTIYCEAESQPSGWDAEWNLDPRPVVWGHTHNYTYSDNGDFDHNMICADCGYTAIQEHSYNVEERVDATHTEEGYVKYYCVCGKLGETTVLDIIPHEFTELISVDDKYHIRKCACGFEETKEHEFTKNVIVEASHTTVGQTENVCECGFKSMSVIQFIHPLLYGSYTKVVTEPTCTTQGYTTYSCGCGEIWIKDYVDAIGHNFISETVDPTCSTEGYTKYTCSNCGDSYSEESEKLSHEFTELIYVDNEYHIRKCACGFEETVEHEFTRYILIEATHTTNGTDEYVCDCGHKYGSVWVKICPLLLMAKYVVTDPTCTEQGYTTVNCGCGETWTEDYVDALGHNYESQITVAPTVTNCGEEKFTCVNCGDSYTEILDKIVIPDVNNETVTLKDGTVLPIWDTNGDALIWFKSEANQNDGYALYDFVKAQSSEVDYTTSWAGGINGVHANQVGTVTITVKGVTYASSLIVVFNINDADVVVTTSSHNCVGNSVNCLSGVFKGSTNLEYAYLKSDTVAIQSNAFYGASNLKYVNFVELTELNQIISQGFSGCKSLFDGETLDLSKTKLVTINNGTFNDVPAKAIILPSGIKNLASWAIQGMTKLEEFHIPETVTSFGETMFKNCYSLKKVTGYKALFERGVIDSIQANTFLDCRSLTSVDFPDSYVSIGANAFKGMTAYTDAFRISDNCTSIGSSSFQNTAFETIIVGTGITAIPSHAFRDSSIKNIVLSANITSIGQEAFRTMKNKLVVYYTGNDTEYLKSITVNNYNGVILDASTVYVSADDFDIENKEDKNYVVYGYNFCEAFYNGNHTYDITVVNPTCTENGSTTYTCSVCNISYTEVIEATGHSYNTVVTEPSCTEQGYTTHTCACGDYYIDNYVEATGHNYVKYECSCGDKLYEMKWDVSATENDDVTVYLVNGTLIVSGTGAMADDVNYWNFNSQYSPSEIIIEEGITRIGVDSFYLCYGVTKVTISRTVTSIGDSAFLWCENLESVVIPDSVVEIGGGAFGISSDSRLRKMTVYAEAWCEPDGWDNDWLANTGYNYVVWHYRYDHAYEEKVTDPTCTAQGYTTHICPCGDYYIDNYVDETGHNYNSVVTDPSCEETGKTTYTCVNCGNSYEEEIEATGHSYNTVVTEPTCTEQGYTTYTCECGDTYVDNYVDAKGHTYTSEVTKAPTHLAEGERTYTCHCGDSYTETIERISEHSYNTVVTDPTCTEQGYTTYTCECGDTYVDNYIDAKGHTYTSEVTKAPTHMTEGERTYTCHCGDSYTETIEKIAEHSYNTVVTDPTCTEQGYTTYTCECGYTYVDNYVDAKGHTYTSEVTKAPTHLAEGERTYTCHCGDSYTETIERISEHSYNTVVTKPTCTEQGYTTYTCECGYTYVDNYVDATGHSYNSVVTDPSCEETGKTTYTCVNCGNSYEEEIEATGHSYNTVVTEPSCTEQGFTTNTCIICGDSYVDNYVDALGHTWSSWSETDDETIYVRTCICGAVDYQTVEKEDDNIEVTPDVDKKKDKVKIDVVFDVPTLEMIGIQIIPEIMEQLNNMETEINTDLGQIILDAIASSKIAGQEGSVNIGIQDITTDKEAKTGHKVFSITVNDENGNPILPPAEADENGTVTLSFKYHKGLTKEQIKIAYRDENGKLEHMEVEKYDPETGEVTFKTTHLSEYVIYTEEAQPEVYLNNIFEFRGYSVNETTGDICYGFVINYEALSAYENTSGNNASIGIVFASYELLNGKQPLDENGNATKLDIGAVVTMDLSEYTYITYEFVLTDITEEIADHKFVISAYVNANGQNTYFQSNGASSTVEGKSYNEIHAIVKEN